MPVSPEKRSTSFGQAKQLGAERQVGDSSAPLSELRDWPPIHKILQDLFLGPTVLLDKIPVPDTVGYYGKL